MPPVRKLKPKSSSGGMKIKGRNSGKGLGRVNEAIKRSDERRAAAGRRFLKLGDGDQVVCRVLDVDDDFRDGYFHRVPMQGKKGRYFADVPCLDQDDEGIPCPGCKDDIPKSYKFLTNVIVRDWEDEANEGKPEDVVMILKQGITMARRLNKMHQRHGLQNRDIIIEREGDDKDNTKYDIDWADDSNTPLSDADEKLAKKKHDLDRYTKPPEYDDFYKSPSERGAGDDDDEDQEEIGRNALNRNTFRRKKSERTKTGTSRIKAGGSKTTTVRRRSR